MTHRHRGEPITVGVAAEQPAVLAFAAEEARLADCDIRLVRAYTVPPAPPTVVGSAYGIDVEGTFRDSGRAVLDEAAAVLAAGHSGIVVHRILERGGASHVLTAMSETSRLVVLGPDDTVPWYTRLFESRVSRKLAQAAACPVVVVPDSWGRAPRTRSVTLLLDGRTVAHGPLRFAFDHAARHQDVLTIVHLRGADGAGWDAPTSHDMTRLVESWRVRYPEVAAEVEAIDEFADLETVESFESTDVLVLGRPHHGRVPAPLHRSLARVVIEHADCAVAVVPPDHDG